MLKIKNNRLKQTSIWITLPLEAPLSMGGAVTVVFLSFKYYDSHNKGFMNRSRFSGPYCTGIAGPVSAHLTKRELWYPLVMWKVIVTDHFCYVNGTSIIFLVKQRAKKWMFFMNVYFWFLLKVRNSRKNILVPSIFQKTLKIFSKFLPQPLKSGRAEK